MDKPSANLSMQGHKIPVDPDRRFEALLQSQEEVSALRLLADASEKLWQIRDLKAGLQEILMASIRLMGADKGNVQLLDARDVLRIHAQHGFDAHFLTFFAEVRTDDDSACGRSLRGRQPVFIGDVERDAEYRPYRDAARRAGYRAVLSTPIISPGGKILGMLSTHFAAPKTDIAAQTVGILELYAKLAAAFIERLAHEEEIQFLNSELNHRAKNLLALVGAIAHATIPAEASSAFAERLKSLAAIHDLVVRRDWKQIDLKALAETQLANFARRGKIRMTGPEVRLDASDAQTLGLALHELLTNSAKYGALSNGHGEVSFTWTVTPDKDGNREVVTRWIESGGPPVHPPARRGFGSKVLDRFAAQSADGRTCLEFAPEGVRWQASWRSAGIAGAD